MKKTNKKMTKIKALILYTIAALIICIPITISYGLVCAAWVYYVLDKISLVLAASITALNIATMTVLWLGVIGDE